MHERCSERTQELRARRRQPVFVYTSSRFFRQLVFRGVQHMSFSVDVEVASIGMWLSGKFLLKSWSCSVVSSFLGLDEARAAALLKQPLACKRALRAVENALAAAKARRYPIEW